MKVYWGVLEEQLELIDYDELKDDGETLNFESNNGWIGITDKYWLAALIPDQTENFKAIYTYDNGYIAYFRSLKSSNVKPGQELEKIVKYLLGLKRLNLLISIRKIMTFIILT